MKTVNGQSWVILFRTTPYGNHLSRAAIDVALTAAAFEQRVSCVFMDDGVLQLLEGQDTDSGGQKNIGRMIPALELYDVEAVYHHAASARQYGLTADQLPASEAIDDAALKALVRQADQVMVF